jgi:hypothetical protein
MDIKETKAGAVLLLQGKVKAKGKVHPSDGRAGRHYKEHQLSLGVVSPGKLVINSSHMSSWGVLGLGWSDWGCQVL